MGRKTWDGLPRKPLPGRLNIVVTRNRTFSAEGGQSAASLADAIAIAEATGAAEICVIGGGEIFREALPLASRLHLTEVECTVAGDTTFPEIIKEDWIEVASLRFEAGPQDSAAFTYRQLDRRRT
jgi:dihydrofolate reductase